MGIAANSICENKPYIWINMSNIHNPGLAFFFMNFLNSIIKVIKKVNYCEIMPIF
jgi:hypothetical protein